MKKKTPSTTEPKLSPPNDLITEAPPGYAAIGSILLEEGAARHVAEETPIEPEPEPQPQATNGHPRTILVTGGAGFIGSNFVRWLLGREPNINVINLDALTYAGNLENLAGLESDPRHLFIRGDICNGPLIIDTLDRHKIEMIIHFAAESHVDRSILSAADFVRTNVLGTQTLLEAALESGLQRFVMVSTDEVYGSLGAEGLFTEETPLAPNSPYSASKASADLLCRAWHHTFDLPVIVTRCSNNYGPFQFPEKLIPLMIIKALSNEPLPVYGDGLNVRDWIHVTDHCAAVWAAAERGRPGEIYNVGAANERANIDIVKLILRILEKPESLIRHIEDRPGHDRRYAIDSAKAVTQLTWAPVVEFESGLSQTVDWYMKNEHWWRRVMSGEYLSYYEKNYAGKMSQ